MKFPIYKPYLKGNEQKYVIDALETNWISSHGKYIELFERACSEFIGTDHAIAVSNGTTALHLALLAIGVGPGDTVIVPDLTYIASANAVIYCGAQVKLVDVNPNDWNISPDALEAAIDNSVKAVVITDLYGAPFKLNPQVHALLKGMKIPIVEDAAEALGSSIEGKNAGSLGEISVLSFFGNKTITTGEGGMVLTNCHQKAALIKKLKNQGNSNTRRYFHDILGFNYRMTNIQAAIGLAQMECLDKVIAKKQNIHNWYKQYLGDHLRFQILQDNTASNYWLTTILLPEAIDREHLMHRLEAYGIETRPIFVPISEMPYMPKKNTPISHWLGERGLSLPSFPELRKTDVSFISEKILETLKEL